MKKFGLSLLLVVSISQFSLIAFSAPKDGERIEDWTVSCKTKEGKTTCSVFQILESNDEKKEKVASIKIYSSEEGVFKVVEVLPFGVNIKSGSSIICDGKNVVANGEFITCYDHGCVAHALMSKEDLEVVLNSKSNHIRVVSINGKVVDIPFYNNGLKSALEIIENSENKSADNKNE